MNNEITLDVEGDDYSEPVSQVSIIKRYLTFLKKWWWIPMLISLMTLGGAAYYFSTQPPSYSSFARMGVLGRARLAEGGLYSDEPTFFFTTQIELMRSPQIAERANSRLQMLTQGKKPPKVKLKIALVPKSTLLFLEASSRDSAYTKPYLDAIMAEYLRYRRELREASSQSQLDTLSDQLGRQQTTVKEAQDRLNKFQQEHNDVVLQQLGAAEAASLGVFKKDYADLKLQRELLGLIALDRSSSASNRIEMLAPDSLRLKDSTQNTSAAGTGAPITEFVTARQRIQELKVQLEELSRNLRPAHPKVQTLMKAIELAEKNVQEYLKLNREQTLAQKHDLELRMKALDDAIVDAEGKVMVTQNQLGEYKKLEMDHTRELNAYDYLRQLARTVGFNQNVSRKT